MASKHNSIALKRLGIITLLTLVSVAASYLFTQGILDLLITQDGMGAMFMAIFAAIPTFFISLGAMIFGIKFTLKKPLKGIFIYFLILCFSGLLFLRAMHAHGKLFWLPFLSVGQVPVTKQELKEAESLLLTTIYVPHYIPPKTKPSFFSSAMESCGVVRFNYSYDFEIIEMQANCWKDNIPENDLIQHEELKIEGIDEPLSIYHYYYGSTEFFRYVGKIDTTAIIIEFDLSKAHILTREEVIKIYQSLKSLD